MINIVELVAEKEKCAFDQPCKFGHRVESHAVYCHNDKWEDSPRKCRRTWYTNGDVRDEDCPGFQPNANFTGAFHHTPAPERLCSQCHGVKLIPTDRSMVETCGHCMGDGAEPHEMPLSQYQQDTLEMGCEHTGKHPGRGDVYARIGETDDDCKAIFQLSEASLISIRSISHTKAGATVFCILLTPKGDAVMRANWEAAGDAGGPTR